MKKGAHPFGYSFFYALDKAICTFLAETLGIPLLHPTTPEQVDKLLAQSRRVSKAVAVVATVMALISSFRYQGREAA